MLKSSPTVHAYLPYYEDSFEDGCIDFFHFVRSLEPIAEYTRNYRVLTQENQIYEKNGGLDLLKDFDDIIEFWNSLGGYNREKPSQLRAVVENWEDGTLVSQIKYNWRSSDGIWINHVEYKDYISIAERQDAPFEFIYNIIKRIIKWKNVTYLWVGDKRYFSERYGAFSPKRTVVNWCAWVPQQVNKTILPSAYSVRPMSGGTLIISTEKYFTINDEDAVHMANLVEAEMYEAGLLPSMRDLA